MKERSYKDNEISSSFTIRLFQWYWKAEVSHWLLYGVWIKQKYWIGFAIVKEETGNE